MSYVNVSLDWAAEQGKRSYMEDRLCISRPTKETVLAIVCDGHGGDTCAEYTSKRVQEVMHEAKGTLDLKEAIITVADEWKHKCLKKLKAKAMPKTQKERKAIFDKAGDAFYKNGFTSGTTIVATMLNVYEKTGQVVYVGDSRAVWKDFGHHNPRARGTKDHKPERSSLGPLGGRITENKNDVPRINRDLAVGRAIGDVSKELLGSVTHTPDNYNIQWTGKGPFTMILCTDGVSDVIKKNTDIISQTEKHSAQQIVDRSLQLGSTDNVSCVIIRVFYEE